MAGLSRAEYEDRLRRIRLLLLDVDGVLTGGGILYFEGDMEGKQFHVRDGSAMFIARLVGLRTAIITARSSEAVARRFSELPVDYVRQGEKQKLNAYREIQRDAGVTDEEVAYIGDDLIDLPLMEQVGLSVAVADGHEQLRARVDWVTQKPGGGGAVREVIDDFVTARDLWDTVIDDYRRRFGEGVGTAAEGRA